MADKKTKPNIFKRIGQRFVEVRQELKRVIWPTREKLIQTTVVVLAVILLATVFLALLIGDGGRLLLEKVGFYAATATESSLADVSATTAPTVESTGATSDTVNVTLESTAAESASTTTAGS